MHWLNYLMQILVIYHAHKIAAMHFWAKTNATNCAAFAPAMMNANATNLFNNSCYTVVCITNYLSASFKSGGINRIDNSCSPMLRFVT